MDGHVVITYHLHNDFLYISLYKYTCMTILLSSPRIYHRFDKPLGDKGWWLQQQNAILDINSASSELIIIIIIIIILYCLHFYSRRFGSYK